MAKIRELSGTLKNYIINGNFDFWQRGTSSSTAGGNYSADRMRQTGSSSGTIAISRQAFAIGQTAVPNNPTYYLNWTQTSASTAMSLAHRIEKVNTLAGKTVTFSLWARSNSGSVSCNVFIGQSFGSGGSPSAAVTSVIKAITITSSWQRFDIVTTLPGISGKTLGTNGDDYLVLALEFPISGSWNIDTAQWMLNEGAVAAPFRLAGSDLQDELSKCHRYCYTIINETGGNQAFAIIGQASAATTMQAQLLLPVPMRVTPSVTGLGVQINAVNTGVTQPISSFSTPGSAQLTDVKSVIFVCNTSGLTPTAYYRLEWPAGTPANSRIIFSAEL